ncbi:MAG: hypothetical protein LBC27_03850 [Spirochaetaceae bacterium]|jgi:hypothetical protein|nr:hypothetical protein [Spirochaetaceae bacterium]
MNDVFCYERKYSVYKRNFAMELSKPVLGAVADLFSADSKKKIRKILGKRISNMLYETVRGS